MKARLFLAALPCLAFARPHPLKDAVTTAPASSSAVPVPSDAPLISAVSSAVSSAGLKPYATPLASEPITEWNALGDSFTAGIGSNGLDDYIRTSFDCQRFQQSYALKMNADARLPGDPKTRKLNFGACSGNEIPDMQSNQLTDNPKQGYVAFGKPQVAVMTISGNDLGFGNAINSCIIRAWGWPSIPDCDTVLTGIEQKIESQEFQKQLDSIFLQTVIKGRSNGGANPPQSFQLFVNGYVPFWNEVDTGCDEVTWEWWGKTKDHLLTTALRKRLNDMVRNLNSQIQRSASRLAGEGVIYVEGFQEAYVGHQFCDPAADSNLMNPINANTWFWASNSPWNGGEGPSTPSDYSLPEAILESLVPDETNRKAILAGKLDPSKVSDAFTSYEKFTAALEAADAKDNDNLQALSTSNRRIFHPKGTAFNAHAKANIDQIIASRSKGASASTPNCQKGNTIKEGDLKDAMNDLTAKGNGNTKDNCCGGGILARGPILAQKGTASISLSGSTQQCMGCGDLATVIGNILDKCLVNGALGGANETIAGKQGLSVQVDFVDSH